jgi:hypothetical protein
MPFGDVTFISAKKIPRIRRRLGFPERISDLRAVDFFSLADTYAHLKSKRGERDLLNRELHRIRQAVLLLASSQFYRERRNRRRYFGGPEYATFLHDQHLLVDITSRSVVTNWHRLSPMEPYTLDKQWEGFFRRHFFPKLLHIINGQVKISNDWFYCIRNAALFAGQSYQARTRWEMLLYDMIGIDTLLLRRKENSQDALIERLEALFGWFTIEVDDQLQWKDLISKLYSLRNKIVHDGDVRDVTMQDVINADMILGNLLNNICALPKRFPSKKAIIDLADCLKARKVLGMKPARPKQLSFVWQHMTETERMNLEREWHWAW